MTMSDFLFPNDILGKVLYSFYNEERCDMTGTKTCKSLMLE